MTAETKQLGLLVLLMWLLYKREEVTSAISFPEAPNGQCYDAETGAYYVGNCVSPEESRLWFAE